MYNVFRTANNKARYLYVISKQMKLPILILFCLLYGPAFCQDISGKWTGNYGKSLFSADINGLEVEIELYNDSLVRGTSRLTYGRDKYEYYKINGVYHRADSTIYFSEDEEIDVNLGMLADNVMGSYTMKLETTDTSMRLEGKWKENGEGLLKMMATKVWLEKPLVSNTPANRKADSSAGVAQGVKPSKQDDKPVEKKSARELVIQREIEIDTIEQDSIRIDIIDNARLDNDVISIYLGDSLLVHKYTISREPLRLYIHLDEHTVNRTIRVKAESYGSMPPCTAHMRVTICKNIYTFDVQSTYKTDAGVEFYLKGSRDANPEPR